VIDLGGAFAMPGLIDVHTHPITTGIDWSNLALSDPTNVDAILAEVRAFAEANKDLPVIRGGSWNRGVFENDSPRKELIDEIVSDRPVYIISQTGHSAWANSKALEMAESRRKRRTPIRSFSISTPNPVNLPEPSVSLP
jgi:predicted amidohydrolase YtcJ